MGMIAILIPGIFFRVFHLGTLFFSGDEPLHQIRISYQSLSFVLANNNGPFFSLLVHFLLPLGRMEIMSRLVSMVSGVLIILVAYKLGKMLFSKTEGLIAALFVGCSQLLVFYSQHSRSYSLFTLLAMTSLVFFLRAVRDGRTRDWAWFAVGTTLTIYTQIIGVIILPAYAVYMGARWMERRRASPKILPGLPAHRELRSFVLWTTGSVVLAAGLLLPCAWVKGMFIGSLQRGMGAPSAGAKITLAFINRTLRFQIAPTSTILYLFTMALLLAGLIFLFRKSRSASLFLFAYICLPWLIFIVSGPRETTIHSLYRYLMFVLPPVFLLAARGLVMLSAFVSAALFKGRPAGFARRLILWPAALIMAAGYFSGLGDYYFQDYWRQGSFGWDRTVVRYIQENARRDAIVYLDYYPVSSATLILNPVARDIGPEDVSIPVRENYVRPVESRDIILHVEEWNFFEIYVASRKIEVWAVTPRDPASLDALRAAMAGIPDAEMIELGGNVVLHFKKNAEAGAEKLAALAEVLLGLPQKDAVLLRQRRLLAAKMFFMTREASEGIREIEAFRSVSPGPAEDARHSGGWIERNLGRLLGFPPAKLRELYETRALSEIQHVAYLHGNNLLATGRLDEAMKVYGEVLSIGSAFDEKVLSRLTGAADAYEKAGDPAKALSVWELARRYAPARGDLSARIEALKRKAGRGGAGL